MLSQSLIEPKNVVSLEKALVKSEQHSPVVLDYQLKDGLANSFIFKYSKYFSYFLGSSYIDMEKQFLFNYDIIYQNKNIVYDEKNKKIIVSNIPSFLNTKIYFAKSYCKFCPGFLKMRDQLCLNFRIYFKFMKNKDNQYYLKSFSKIVF